MRSTIHSKRLLAQLKLNEINFEGFTTYLPTEKDYFDIFPSKSELELIRENIKELKKYLKNHVIPKFPLPHDGIEIGYSGKIEEEEIFIEELFQIKYLVDKNKKKEKIYLLE